MEFDVFKVLLCHLENIARISEENVSALTITSHILMLTFLEGLKFLFIAGHCFYPASLVKTAGFPAALGSVLVLQSVLDDLEL